MAMHDEEFESFLKMVKKEKKTLVKKLQAKSLANRYHPDFEVHPEPVYMNTEDTNMRLDSSIVRYKGNPYWAQATGNKARINLCSLVKENEGSPIYEIDANDPDLDVSSIEIGYCNHKSLGTVFITRAPYRKQKQGLSSVNTLWTTVGGSNLKSLTATQFFDEGIIDAILGNYPSVKTAVKSLGNSFGDWKAEAISSSFCLFADPKGSITVYFEQSKIGKLEEDNSMTGSLGYVDSILVMKLASLGIGVN